MHFSPPPPHLVLLFSFYPRLKNKMQWSQGGFPPLLCDDSRKRRKSSGEEKEGLGREKENSGRRQNNHFCVEREEEERHPAFTNRRQLFGIFGMALPCCVCSLSLSTCKSTLHTGMFCACRLIMCNELCFCAGTAHKTHPLPPKPH